MYVKTDAKKIRTSTQTSQMQEKVSYFFINHTSRRHVFNIIMLSLSDRYVGRLSLHSSRHSCLSIEDDKGKIRCVLSDRNFLHIFFFFFFPIFFIDFFKLASETLTSLILIKFDFFNFKIKLFDEFI